MHQRELHFPGPDDPTKQRRLTAQLGRIFHVMLDGEWHTLAEISALTGAPTPSVSAQLRHLRKPEFGGYTVEREHIGNGLYQYRLLAARSLSDSGACKN